MADELEEVPADEAVIRLMAHYDDRDAKEGFLTPAQRRFVRGSLEDSARYIREWMAEEGIVFAQRRARHDDT